MNYATTDFIKLPDEEGEMVFIGTLVHHINHPTLIGRITEISIPYKGAGVCKFLVEPEGDEALEKARKVGNCWPLQTKSVGEPPREYVQVRDTGLPAWMWKRC